MIARLVLFLCITTLGLSGAKVYAANPPQLAVVVDHGVTLTLPAPAASVFIANPDIADIQVMSPTSIMVFGKRVGETTFLATNGKGEKMVERTVSVNQDISALRTELDAAIPHNKIKIMAVPNGLVLTGEAHDPSVIADAYKLAQRYLPPSGGDIINRIKIVGSNQIMIRVRFAEVQRNIDNSFGVDLQNLSNYGSSQLTAVTGATVSGTSLSDNIAALSLTNAGENFRPNNTTLTTRNDLLGIKFFGGRTNLSAVIDALAQDGLVKILAEPNLTAMSGETANFLAGGEFPVPIPQGNGTISVEYKPYGISLSFTPTLIGENRINLHVRPEVSELTQAGAIILTNISIPAITTRKAETTVEVGSGESFAIAGLLNNDQRQTINKFPILGDLPILGPLFRSDHFQNGQTELVVVITPYLVKPSDEQLALPMDGYTPPNEFERLGQLRTNGTDPKARSMSGDPVAREAKPVSPDLASAMSDPMPAPLAPVQREDSAPTALVPRTPVSNITNNNALPTVPEPTPARAESQAVSAPRVDINPNLVQKPAAAAMTGDGFVLN